jgi:hypothetical protein
MNPAVLLHYIYTLHEAGQTCTVLTMIFNWVDADLKATKGEGCHELLSCVNVNRLDEDLLVGLLTSTYPGRNLITSREVFAYRVRQKLEQDIVHIEATKLLDEIV